MAAPRPSSFRTVSLPQLSGGSGSAIEVARAEDTAVRVIVQNDSGSLGTARVSVDAGELNNSGSSNAGYLFPLVPGSSQIFVLSAGQSLFAIAFGGAALLSMAQSDAFPITIRR